MQTNFLEELAAEWLEYKGYIVKRNERVGRRGAGGHEGELDVVAFNPKTKHLVHVETSSDADSWAERERRFSKRLGVTRTTRRLAAVKSFLPRISSWRFCAS